MHFWEEKDCKRIPCQDPAGIPVALAGYRKVALCEIFSGMVVDPPGKRRFNIFVNRAPH